MKNHSILNKLSLLALGLIVLVGGIVFSVSQNPDQKIINEAEAAAQCPAYASDININVRQGSAGGALLGSYNVGPSYSGNEWEWMGSATLSVPYNTVIYFEASAPGADPTSFGDVTSQQSNLPVTVHNNPATGGGGGYKPTGYSYTRQLWVTATSDPLTTGGFININNSNTCLPGKGYTGDEWADSGFNLTIQVGSAPNYTFSCGVNQTVQIGSTANFIQSASVDSGYNGTINVTMSASPSGPALVTTPVVLNTGNSYSGTAQVNTTGLTPGQAYVLTFRANDGVHPEKTCQANLTPTEPNVDVDLFFDGVEFGPTSPTPSNGSGGTLTWVVDEGAPAASCSGSMAPGSTSDPTGWTGPGKNTTSGSFAVTGMQQNTNYIFRISCSNGYTQTSIADVAVNVGPPNNPAILSMYCRGDGDKDPQPGPCSVPYNTAGDLTWSSQYATNGCVITSPQHTGWSLTGTSGTNISTPPLTASSNTFNITCTGASGTTPATGSVVINVVANPNFSLNCGATPVTVQQGDTHNFFISVTPVDGYNSNVTMSNTISPVTNAPTVSYNSTNPSVSPYSTATTAIVTTNFSTGVGAYTITFSGNGINPINCVVNVTAAPDPPNPINVTSANTPTCGAITVSWAAGPGSPNPTSFNIYRSLNGTTWGTPIANVPFGTTSYVDSGATIDVLTYHAVTAVLGASETDPNNSKVGTPVAAQSCAPDLSTSDKDLIQVNKNTVGYTGSTCNGPVVDVFELPNKGVFTQGDSLTFQVNVCNSGNQDLTGVSVVDTFLNLSNVAWDSGNSGKCVQSFNGTTFFLDDIPAGTACNIVMTATIAPPSGPAGPAGTLYRFQNTAQINTNQANYRVSTPPYLYSTGSSDPTRTETAPQ